MTATVARVLAEPTRRDSGDGAEARRPTEAVLSWIQSDIPTTRMLEPPRQDPTAPYTPGGSVSMLRGAAAGRARGRHGAGDPLRGLPGNTCSGTGANPRPAQLQPTERVSVAEPDGPGDAPARDARGRRGVGRVPWAWVFDNMKTGTLGRDAADQPRRNPALWRFATQVGCHPELCDPGAAQQKGSG